MDDKEKEGKEKENSKDSEEKNNLEGKEEIPSAQANKISFAEILLITPLTLLVDFLDFIGGAAEVSVFFAPIGFFIRFIGFLSTALIQIYLIIKGVKNFYNIIMGTLDSALPFVSFLPLHTTGWLLTVYFHNKSKE